MDYRTVGKNRDISLGLVGDVGAILKAVTEAASGRLDDGPATQGVARQRLRTAEEAAYQKLLPEFHSDQVPISPTGSRTS